MKELIEDLRNMFKLSFILDFLSTLWHLDITHDRKFHFKWERYKKEE